MEIAFNLVKTVVRNFNRPSNLYFSKYILHFYAHICSRYKNIFSNNIIDSRLDAMKARSSTQNSGLNSYALPTEVPGRYHGQPLLTQTTDIHLVYYLKHLNRINRRIISLFAQNLFNSMLILVFSLSRNNRTG